MFSSFLKECPSETCRAAHMQLKMEFEQRRLFLLFLAFLVHSIPATTVNLLTSLLPLVASQLTLPKIDHRYSYNLDTKSPPRVPAYAGHTSFPVWRIRQAHDGFSMPYTTFFTMTTRRNSDNFRLLFYSIVLNLYILANFHLLIQSYGLDKSYSGVLPLLFPKEHLTSGETSASVAYHTFP